MIARFSRSFTRALVLAAMACGGTVALAACGGEAQVGTSPKAPESTVVSEPESIEEAQQRIAAAKAELASATGDSATGGFARPPPGAEAPRPAEPISPHSTSPLSPAKPSARPSAPTSPADADSAPSKAGRNADDRCGSPCRAIASMRRAVTALCRMTGNEDARCVDAKRTLVESEGRISPCSC